MFASEIHLLVDRGSHFEVFKKIGMVQILERVEIEEHDGEETPNGS